MDDKGRLKMIRDVLDWPLPAEGKLDYIQKVVEEETGAEEKPATTRKRAPSRKTTTKTRSRRTEPGSRSALWAELKKVAPERAEKLGYNAATKENLQKILAEAKGGKS